MESKKRNYKTAKELQIEEAQHMAELNKAKTKGPQFPSQKAVDKPKETKQENVAETFKK